MIRSRRSRRSTSQNVARLVAFGLPSPLQRVADTQIGPLLMLIFVPALIVTGIASINWENGTPSFSFNKDRAYQLRETAIRELDNLGLPKVWEDVYSTAVRLKGQTGQLGFGTPLGGNTHVGFPSTQPIASQNYPQNYLTHNAQYPTTHPSYQNAYAQNQYGNDPSYAYSGTYAQSPAHQPSANYYSSTNQNHANPSMNYSNNLYPQNSQYSQQSTYSQPQNSSYMAASNSWPQSNANGYQSNTNGFQSNVNGYQTNAAGNQSYIPGYSANPYASNHSSQYGNSPYAPQQYSPYQNSNNAAQQSLQPYQPQQFQSSQQNAQFPTHYSQSAWNNQYNANGQYNSNGWTDSGTSLLASRGVGSNAPSAQFLNPNYPYASNQQRPSTSNSQSSFLTTPNSQYNSPIFKPSTGNNSLRSFAR